MAKIVNKVTVNCSLKDAHDFILEPSHLKLLPGVKEVAKSEEKEDTFLIKGREKLPILGLESAAYKLCIDEKTPDSISYHLEGYAYEVKGGWKLSQSDGKTEIKFTMEYTIPGSIFGQFVDRVFIEKSLTEEIEKYISSLKNFLVGVEEVMTKNVISVSVDTPISEVLEKMEELNVRYIPVVEGNKLVGVVTDGDILSRMYAQGWTSGERPISEIMTKEVKSIEPQVSLFRAIRYLTSHRVRRLPVAKKTGELVGVLSVTDLEEHLGMLKKKRRSSVVWGEVSEE